MLTDWKNDDELDSLDIACSGEARREQEQREEEEEEEEAGEGARCRCSTGRRWD